MASLILSAAGAAVGGPVGGAIGTLIGRQVDQSFGKPGARLSDFRAPSSQYGDAIPQVLNRMRVAGVVLWTGDPVATATVSKSGSDPGSSVSFAYGLSSGTLDDVGRIWADGRLIRDNEARQALSFSMRLHKGDEDQLSDPLIASTLGYDRAPAFRGIAYLVFENFDLSTFGNRLPLITVEVIGAGEPISAQSIIRSKLELADKSGAQEATLEGFALVGDDYASALAPLCEAFSPAFGYRNDCWTFEQSSAFHIIDRRLWIIEQNRRLSTLASEGDAPTRVSIRYYDPAIDFAGGEKSARIPGPERLRRIEVPAVLDGSRAKALAYEQLAAAAVESGDFWLSLPLSFAHIAVGDQISCDDGREERYTACEKVLLSAGLRLRLRRAAVSIGPLTTEAGGVVGLRTLTRTPLSIGLVELPGEMFTSEPQLAIAVSGGFEPFEPLPITLSIAGRESEVISANFPAPQGKLLSPLPHFQSELLDLQNVIEVAFEQDPVLTSCSEAAVLAGENLISVGGELIQYMIAQPVADATYRLSGLLRARFDSRAQNSHGLGTIVTIVRPAAIKTVALPRECIGATVVVQVHGPDASSAQATIKVTGRAARPWAPSHVKVTEHAEGLGLSWVRRCKEGLPWLDEVDAPLGSSREIYSLRLEDGQGVSFEMSTVTTAALIDWPALERLGPRPWRLELRQLGDFAAGYPSLHIIE